MVRGVTAIAQGDQVGWIIASPSGLRDQMMNVGFATGARFAARCATVRVASEHYGANGTPLLELCFGRRGGVRAQMDQRLPANHGWKWQRGESVALTCRLARNRRVTRERRGLSRDSGWL